MHEMVLLQSEGFHAPAEGPVTASPIKSSHSLPEMPASGLSRQPAASKQA
jgi:hypothetical protein